MGQTDEETATLLFKKCSALPNRVTGGKTPSEYIFSELPQVADIAGSAFRHVASPLVS
jgi:hypothetical protein